jgi:hypothetical protein
MQVAQEAAMRDLFSQLGGLQEKLTADPQLSDLLSRFAERIQEDLGGPEELEKLLRGLGFEGRGAAPDTGPRPPAYDDRPAPPGARPTPPDEGMWPRPPRQDPPGPQDAGPGEPADSAG